jgi:hypothetical protein
VQGDLGDVELVLLSDALRFELYTTEARAGAVVRSVLLRLLERAGDRAKLGELRSIRADGPAVLRRLMRKASGIGCAPGVKMPAALELAVTSARAAGTLGVELEALFGSAIAAGVRVGAETSIAEAGDDSHDRELVLLEIERIVEEEIVLWRSARMHECAEHAPPESLDAGRYLRAEPASAVRAKLSGLLSTRVA